MSTRRVWTLTLLAGPMACAKIGSGFGGDVSDADTAKDARHSPTDDADVRVDAELSANSVDASENDASEGDVSTIPGVDAAGPPPFCATSYTFGPPSTMTGTACFCASPNQSNDICSVCRGLVACGCSGGASVRPDISGCITVSGDAGVATGHCCPSQCVRSSQTDSTCAATELGYFCNAGVVPPAGCRTNPTPGNPIYQCCPRP